MSLLLRKLLTCGIHHHTHFRNTRTKHSSSYHARTGFLTILFLVVLIAAENADAQMWESLTVPTSNAITGISFIDVNTGWISGPNGLILHTTDGGDSWITQASGTSAGLKSIQFVDALNGWAAGGITTPVQSGLIIHTTDGGQTWTNQNVQSSYFILNIHFVDPQLGWALRGWGTLLNTVNGGSSWTEQNTSVSQRLDEIAFVNASQGWAVGQNGSIVHTVNGGNNWTLQNSGTTDWINGITCTSEQEAWASGGWPNVGMILHTTNGGGTWVRQTVPTTQQLQGLTFVTPSLGWAVGNNGVIVHTTDGGATWVLQNSGTVQQLLKAEFVDERHGWIIGDHGTVLRYHPLTPDAVTDIAATTEYCDSVLITWDDTASDTVYYLFRDATEIGTAPRDSTRFWDYPSPGIHEYQVAAANSFGRGPLSDPVAGQIRPLLVINPVPDTLHSGEDVLLHFSHCDGVVADSIFLSVGNGTAVFLHTSSPVSDSCQIALPDTFHSGIAACHFMVLSCGAARVDTVVSNRFYLAGTDDSAPPTFAVPARYYLAQNYPNPFNASTVLRFGIARTSEISLQVYDLLGRTQATLAAGRWEPGEYSIKWDCSKCPSGLYIARLQTGNRQMYRQMILIK